MITRYDTCALLCEAARTIPPLFYRCINKADFPTLRSRLLAARGFRWAYGMGVLIVARVSCSMGDGSWAPMINGLESGREWPKFTDQWSDDQRAPIIAGLRQLMCCDHE